MGKLTNNPLGDPLGKVGNFVGGKWKDGIYWIRARVMPAQKGTVKEQHDYIALRRRSFAYKQMNNRNVMRILGHIGRMNLTLLIDNIWTDYCIRHNIHNMTGLNLFVKSNQSNLFNSIPNKSSVWVEASNAAILTNLKVSKGDLESTPILTAVYTGTTLVVTFAATCYTNGAGTDLVYVACAKKPQLNVLSWEPLLFLYPPSRGNSKTRTDATVTLTLPAGLTASDLTAFLFFKDAAGTIGFSDSTALQVTTS